MRERGETLDKCSGTGWVYRWFAHSVDILPVLHLRVCLCFSRGYNTRIMYTVCTCGRANEYQV